VPARSIVEGSPAKIIGYVNNSTYSQIFSDESPNPFSVDEPKLSKIGDSGATLHKLKLIEDLRGDLTVGQFLVDIPFIPKRYFCIFNVPSTESRGEHAHIKCKQFLICIKGQCSVVIDDGIARKEVLLNSPNMGLYIPEFTWAIQYKYSSDAVLVVYASEYYEESDYIRDYAYFLELRIKIRSK
jgi:dTDP-4-dehydrorhamnose 3,5-epimerase-like enzyme